MFESFTTKGLTNINKTNILGENNLYQLLNERSVNTFSENMYNKCLVDLYAIWKIY